MKDTYDFSAAKRGAVAPTKGKTRITIMLDEAVIQAAREQADDKGIGYQTLINGLLRDALGVTSQAASRSRVRSEGPEFAVNALNRRDVEALEVQLNDMAKSLHTLLGEHSKGAPMDIARQATGEPPESYDAGTRRK
jgi:BrnA antitoxin of type II toxin-antitoxin system